MRIETNAAKSKQPNKFETGSESTMKTNSVGDIINSDNLVLEKTLLDSKICFDSSYLGSVEHFLC